MAYKVLVRFKDKKSKQVYEVGDTYPHSGRAAKTRLTELIYADNNLKKPIIEEVK